MERKTAVVTGAASGVGLAIAFQLAEQGANVMFADYDQQLLKSELDPSGDNVDLFVGDLQDHLTQSNLLAATAERFGRIDILVNASRRMMTSSHDDLKPDILDEMFSRNLRQHYTLSRQVARYFTGQDPLPSRPAELAGSIVNVTSIAADRLHPDLVEYSVCCAALEQLTRSLALAFAELRINVNAVAFGSVMSGNLQRKTLENPDIREWIAAATPLGRVAEATEVANAAAFLVSGAASFMTGQILTIDGGRSLLDRYTEPHH